MSSQNTDNLVQDYFNDLLQCNAESSLENKQATVNESIEEAPFPAVEEFAPEKSTSAIDLVVEAAIAEPESLQDKKESLQKLLNSTPLSLEPLLVTKSVISAKQQNEPLDDNVTIEDDMALAIEEGVAEISKQRGLQEKLQWNGNGRPEWAQSAFEALLFTVSGLTLAVPLIALGQIQPITAELTPLFGQADWFMGIQPTPSGKVRTVNTALFVMPERYDDNFPGNAKYVVSINGMPWGLAVDTVKQPITLQPEDVKWRTTHGSRPWLAGTVKKEMCALLDISAIGNMLQDGDKNTASYAV